MSDAHGRAQSAVDDDGRAVDVVGFVRGEEDGGVCRIPGVADAAARCAFVEVLPELLGVVG
jgi:hypothetical protein